MRLAAKESFKRNKARIQTPDLAKGFLNCLNNTRSASR